MLVWKTHRDFGRIEAIVRWWRPTQGTDIKPHSPYKLGRGFENKDFVPARTLCI
jgi:hypothetical protein